MQIKILCTLDPTSLKKLKVKSKIFIYPFNEILKKQKKVIIFLNPENRTSDKELSNLIKSIKLFKSFKYEILLKKHPVSKGILAKELSDSLDLKIDNSLLDGSSILQREYPSFVVVAGLSTVICESLNSGIIPICISETEKSRYNSLLTCPFPFKKRSFFWKDENLEIKYLLENISHYPKYIEKLRTR